MMMSNPEDEMFQNLLSDYAADIDDAGFSAGVMAAIDAKHNYAASIKRRVIAGAIIVGGLIAATQVPALVKLTASIDLPNVTMPSGSPYLMSGVIAVTLFMLWALLDNKGSEVI